MAKHKLPQPDADGILHTGIYKRRVGEISFTEWRDMPQQDAQKPITPEEWRRQLLTHLDSLISSGDQEEVHVAKAARRALQMLKYVIASDAGQDKMIEASMLLSRWLEHLDIQSLESKTLSGRGASARGSHGANVTNAIYVELHSKYQAEVEATMHAKTLSYSEASVVVGRKYGVTDRTVRNHTINPDTQ
jgi:hypothetical protein